MTPHQLAATVRRAHAIGERQENQTGIENYPREWQDTIVAALEAFGAAQGSRPRDFLAWAVRMFGPIAKLRSERLLRFIEEAIELAHAEGMERDVFNRVADRVYSRPAGDVGKEIGQAQACLETFAENIGLSSADEAQREWIRVQEIPQDEWDRRHAAKVALGIATSSQVGGQDPDCYICGTVVAWTNQVCKPQGRCDVTLTERFTNPACRCATYVGNKGPCKTFEAGQNDRCVYCDHEKACHDSLLSSPVSSTHSQSGGGDAGTR